MTRKTIIFSLIVMTAVPVFLFGGGINPATGNFDPTYNNPSPSFSSSTVHQTTIVFPRKMTVNDQIYPFSLDGIKSFMRDIQNDKMELYTALKPDMDDLDKRTSAGMSYMIGGGALGLGIVIGSWILGSTVLAEKKEFMDKTENIPSMGVIMGGTLVGAGIMAAGFFIGSGAMPKDDDYYNFVNKHNKLDKENPIKVELGYNPLKKNFEGTFAIQF